jgi:hypothetical protein
LLSVGENGVELGSLGCGWIIEPAEGFWFCILFGNIGSGMPVVGLKDGGEESGTIGELGATALALNIEAVTLCPAVNSWVLNNTAPLIAATPTTIPPSVILLDGPDGLSVDTVELPATVGVGVDIIEAVGVTDADVVGVTDTDGEGVGVVVEPFRLGVGVGVADDVGVGDAVGAGVVVTVGVGVAPLFNV